MGTLIRIPIRRRITVIRTLRSKGTSISYSTMEQEGTAVAKGNHIVPKGVAVEELDGGKRKLAHQCPPDLEDLLLRTQCMDVYDKLVKAVVEASSTRSVFGKWRDMEFVSIIDLFRSDFAAKGIKVVLCKRKSGCGKFRWLEFIDIHQAPEDYVPQFDVANMSGQVIRTCYSKLEFPNGVAVEELQRYGNARRTLKEQMPIFVEDMLKRKGLLMEYDSMVDDLVRSDVGSWCRQG